MMMMTSPTGGQLRRSSTGQTSASPSGPGTSQTSESTHRPKTRRCNVLPKGFAVTVPTASSRSPMSLSNSVVTRSATFEKIGVMAQVLDEPFLIRIPDCPSSGGSCLVKYYGTSPPQPVDSPLDTVTANGHKYAVSTGEPILLRQQDGGHPWPINQRPVPTIPTRGGHAVVTPSLVMPKNYPKRGIHSNGLYPADSQPCHTITADPRAKLVSPSLIRWSHGGATLDVDEPMPTIATERGGVFSLSSPYLCPLYNPRPKQQPRTREVDRPLMTVPASKSPAALATPLVRPFIDDYEGPAASIDDPLGTITSRERFALCIPELWPWGLDIKYRMLQPDELKQAQGFPESYEIVGTKAQQTEQIGNAVPVNLAKTLCKHVLTAEVPSLASYGGGISRNEEADIPSYEEVISDD
jgi:DNA (cytosine-5)-methyltransferase 1